MVGLSLTPESAARLKLNPRPSWMTTFCKRAAEKIMRPILCPALVPRGLGQTANTQRFVPTRDGYVLDSGGRPRYPYGIPTSHWVFVANVRGLGALGKHVYLAPTQLRGTNGWFSYFPETAGGAGPVSNHLALIWREHGVEYAVTVHRAIPTPPAGQSWTSPAQRRYIRTHTRAAASDLRQVAIRMTTMKPPRSLPRKTAP